MEVDSDENFELPSESDESSDGPDDMEDLIQPLQGIWSKVNKKVSLHDCPKCGRKNFRSIFALLDHVSLHYKDKFRKAFMKSGICRRCHKKCCTVEAFAKHVGTQHMIVLQFLPESERSEITKFCPTKNAKKVESEERGTPCVLCKKNQSSPSDYLAHLSCVHYRAELEEIFDVSNDKCYICGKANSTKIKSNLLIHIGVSHQMVLGFASEEVRKSFEIMNETSGKCIERKLEQGSDVESKEKDIDAVLQDLVVSDDL